MNSHFDDVVDDSKSAVLIALLEPSAKCGICDNACQKNSIGDRLEINDASSLFARVLEFTAFF